MAFRGRRSLLIACCSLLLFGAVGYIAPRLARTTLGKQPLGGILVSTNQTLTPLGIVKTFPYARPKDLALSPNGSLPAVLTTRRVEFFASDGTTGGSVNIAAAPRGIAWTPDGSTVYASQEDGRVCEIKQTDGVWKKAGSFAVEAATGGVRRSGNPQATGLAVSPDGVKLYVALGIRNAVSVVSLPDKTVQTTISVGAAPYTLILTPDGKTLIVANRGGRLAKKGARDTAVSAGTSVRTDKSSDAALRGSLTFIDTEKLTTNEIDAGRQPCGMACAPDGRTLYVANSDDDSISIVDIPSRRIRGNLSLRSQDDAGFGRIPTSLALSADGNTLYAACGGINAVAVFALQPKPELKGYRPTCWFPIAIAEQNGRLFVACSKGVGSRPADKMTKFGVHDSVGTLQILPPVAMESLPDQTMQVAYNNHWGPEPPARRDIAPVPVPERVGEPSVFKHVVYIIKENLTYDIALGDMPDGNGDRSLCAFGEQVTPNHHALARQFVLLDNTFTSGTNSADGHQWTSSSIANGYMEQNYSANARSYPYDGGDPLAYSPAGFLWNAVKRARLSLRVYGEFVNKPKVIDPSTGKMPSWTTCWKDYKDGTNRIQITADTDNAALKPFLHPNYIGWPTEVSDQWRADTFLKDLNEDEKSGKMPALSILLLPCDHTSGTEPGMPTPRAALADNDLALGRIVEGISKSSFWKDTLILVIEDDSQTGVDHVDGHRTVAFCISPYTKRGVVSSEPYNHTSFVRTMGLVLGFPALNRFDRTATSLAACFNAVPDLTPYTVQTNRVALDEMNPPASALRGEARKLAEACAKQDWTSVDRADPTIVARSIWHAQKPGVPFPKNAFHANLDTDGD